MGLETYVITGANGDIAMSMAEILRDLRPEARLIGTDVTAIWPAANVFDEVVIIPKAKSADYTQALKALQDKHANALIIPSSEPELRFLAQNPSMTIGLNLLMNSADLIISMMDKYGCNQWLQNLGIAVPTTLLLHEAKEKDLPLFVKPRFGAGSRGLETVRTVMKLALLQEERDADNVAQELLDVEGQEYTCALLTTDDGYRSFIMHREVKGDITGKMEGVQNDAIERIIKQIAAHIPPRSAINIQLRLMPDGPRIFEINPRFSSTVKMRHLLGFCDFQWALDLHEGRALAPCNPIYGKRVYRAYREIIEE